MTLASDTTIVLYPPEVEARYVREGLWQAPTIAEHLDVSTDSSAHPLVDCDHLPEREARAIERSALAVGGPRLPA